MKNLILYLCSLILMMNTTQSRAQDEAAVAAVGALVGIGAAIASIEQMKEQAELTATEWVLSNHPEMTSFSLKTLDFDGKKMKDMSTVTVISFKIHGFTPSDRPELDGYKYVLFAFTSHGWISDYGIDFNRVKWHLIDSNEWIKMMTSYVKVASPIEDDVIIKETLKGGKIVNRGVKAENDIDFYRLEGDMYLVTDYSNDMKILYNERSLGVFLKETKDLVQIGRGDIIKIHDFFLGEE